MWLLVTVVLWAQPALAADSTHRFLLMTINDDAEAADGKLTLSLESAAGQEVARQELPFSLHGLGQFSYNLDLKIPKVTGNYLLKATAAASGGRHAAPTVSRRRVAIK
jgi:hypothetical protein